MRVWLSRAVLLALAVLAAPTVARAQAPDIVLVNGKIVTVDDRFTIAQALAIRGQRIVKVGSTAEIERLKGPPTRVIDLAGRTVIPGLIDNHAHWVRAAEHDELRFDGVTSRAAGARDARRAGAHDAARRMDRGARRLVGGAIHRRAARLPARGARPHRAQQSGGAAGGL